MPELKTNHPQSFGNTKLDGLTISHGPNHKSDGKQTTALPFESMLSYFSSFSLLANVGRSTIRDIRVVPVISRIPRAQIASRTFLQPRKFPSSGFVNMGSEVKVEEEELPGYVPERYYPVTIGQVFNSRYQVVK